MKHRNGSMIFGLKRDTSPELDWATLQVERRSADSERYLIENESFLARYSSQRLAKKLLKDLMATDHLLLALRHGDGRTHVIEQFFGYVASQKKKRRTLDQDFDNVEKIVLPLINHGRIPSFQAVDRCWSLVTNDDLDQVFASYDWLVLHLPKLDEWSVRELCFRSDLFAKRDDQFFALEEICTPSKLCDRFLSNYKHIKEIILDKDFDKAREDQLDRKQRYAPRTGEGGLYKEVKVRLHPDLIDTLKDVVGGGNRTAWIEEAILQRLENEGVEFSLPEQPPVPHK